MSRLINLDDDRNHYIGMDDEYEQWNIDPNVIATAQPEIIRCRDCTYRNGDYCHRFHDGYSAFIHHDDFCSYAERQEE